MLGFNLITLGGGQRIVWETYERTFCFLLFEVKVGIFVEDHDDNMMIYCPLIVFSDGA
jgi:hypothetical protein